MKIIRFEDLVERNEYVVSVDNIILAQHFYSDASVGYRVYIIPMDEYIPISEETYKRLEGELLCEQ